MVISGTETTNWMPLALISRMMLSPDSPPTAPRPQPHSLTFHAPGNFGPDASTGEIAAREAIAVRRKRLNKVSRAAPTSVPDTVRAGAKAEISVTSTIDIAIHRYDF